MDRPRIQSTAALCAALCAVALFPPPARAQDAAACDQASKELYPDGQQVDAGSLLPLASLKVPESCGTFQFTNLVDCATDLNVKEGCCDESCKAVFSKIPDACIQDVGEVLCGLDEFADFVAIVDNLARRCDDDYSQLSCGSKEEQDQCDASTKTPFPDGKKVDVSSLLPLAKLELPDSCGQFQFHYFVGCSDDWDFEKGCCNLSCQNVFSQVSNTCIQDLGKVLCDMGTFDDVVATVNNLARRCDDDYTEVKCKSKDQTDQGSGECNPDSRTPFPDDEQIDVGELLALATLDTPASCGDWKFASTMDCASEVNMMKGCCDQNCKDVFKPPRACLEDAAQLLCDSGFAEFLPRLNHLAERCDDDYKELVCKKSGKKGKVCKTSSKTPFAESERINVTGLLPIADLEAPKSCSDWPLTKMAGCSAEVNIEEGCCDQICKDVFEIPKECEKDLTKLVCDSGYEDFVLRMNNIARRCSDNYSKLKCKGKGKGKGKGKAGKKGTSTQDSAPCDPESRTPFPDDQKIHEDSLLPMAKLEAPESCGDLQFTGIGACLPEANIKEGCCNQDCRDFFSQVSEECSSDLGELLCSDSNFADIVPRMDNVAKRCDEDYKPLSCEGKADRTAAGDTDTDSTSQATGPCDQGSKVPFPSDQQVDVTSLLPLSDLAVPDTCGDFQFSSLVACTADLNIMEGCCDPNCRDLFAQVPSSCIQDLGKLLCELPEFADFVATVNNLARRCDDDYIEILCDGDGAAAKSGPVANGGQLQDGGVCDEASKTPFPEDQQKDVATLLPLAAQEAPATCAGFEFANLGGCIADLNIMEGCCDQSCRDVFELVPKACFQDVGTLLCSLPEFADFVATVNNLARRCDPNYREISCDAIGTSQNGQPQVLGPCDASTKIPYPEDQQVDVDRLLPLAPLEAPDTCGNFQFTNLVNCAADLNIKEGCCDESCRVVFSQMPSACVQDVGKQLCDIPEYVDFVPIVNNVARRCAVDFMEVSCGGGGSHEGEDQRSPPTVRLRLDFMLESFSCSRSPK
ncbi:unnamed protein product [Ostreobium quekettii]|uniref:Uncharacterized protein n=1 Tax=Ostreobium quekettii TaxID=121088 RepID=A0A8S1JBR4_9CHLO|nr:unnamed protein product [Ostreobium quekettii]|eukprot:evm.model.scf_681.3 EVM.evm.TU.scf_681.3   scf_681:8363-22603(+)